MVRNIIISSQFLVIQRSWGKKQVVPRRMAANHTDDLYCGIIIILKDNLLHFIWQPHASCMMEQYSSANLNMINHLAMYILSIKVEECIWGLQVRYGQYRPHTLQTQNLLLSRNIWERLPLQCQKWFTVHTNQQSCEVWSIFKIKSASEPLIDLLFWYFFGCCRICCCLPNQADFPF